MSQVFTAVWQHRVVWKIVSSLYVGVCLLIDFIPRHARPEFRYTGSDPAVPVWNLGWLLAEFIYDARCGLHIGPTAVPLVLAQFFVCFVGVAVVVAFLRWSQRRQCLRRGFPVVT